MKIIGLGNALLDVLLRLENDDILNDMGVRKGAMDIVDEAQMRTIQKAQSRLERSDAPGGSVCNTIRALARLGAEVGYVGKVGADDNGTVYETAIAKAGVQPHIVYSTGISGCCTVLISPDGERTMATFLGEAATLSADEISDDVLRQYDYIYIEGYLISNEKLFHPILQRAKNFGLKVALDLSNFNIVNEFKDMLKKDIPEYVSVLFSNENEAEAYTGIPVREAINEIMKDVEYSIVTIGKDGALVGSKGEVVHVPALSKKAIDTTGAGDNFAAGFLYGLMQNASLEQKAQIGALMSANVVETVGAQITDDRWSQIKLKIRDILG